VEKLWMSQGIFFNAGTWRGFKRATVLRVESVGTATIVVRFGIALGQRMRLAMAYKFSIVMLKIPS
jgi:hypothetical protein